MCGVVSIVYAGDIVNLGNEASNLLKKLEYRGYDSTGAAFIKEDGSVILRKKVGAPSKVVEQLELAKYNGFKFIGQVRWATYGAVTDVNAQPHEVSCLVHMVGAHNGNVSNTDKLKVFLSENGHDVLSDNDGEMVVHLVEHFYAALTAKKAPKTNDEKIAVMIKAIRKAQKMIEGSYAACVTLPELPGVFAIKAGSSLYAGKGSDASGNFIVVSSDLTSILSKTRFLIPMSEGEGIYFDSENYKMFSLSEDKEWVPKLSRSRLNIADIQLQPKYHFFMEQEIYSSPKNIENLMLYYFNSKEEKELYSVFEENCDSAREILYSLLALYDLYDKKELSAEFEKIRNIPTFRGICDKALGFAPSPRHFSFRSEEKTLLEELYSADGAFFKELWLIDSMLIWKKKRMIIRFRDKLVSALKATKKNGGRIFLIASGTSYHASLTGAYFFNNMTDISLITSNPGTFRSCYINSLSDKDVVIGVSQSGETKDLVDIFNEIRKMSDKTTLITIVNNENSTLPQEKSDFYLPIMCGSEIAVAATKSFISQIALFYILAALVKNSEEKVMNNLSKIKYFMDFTLKNIDVPVADVAYELFMKPSIHILGTSLTGVAKEGALKIREVVLNHTEGYDAAEFKHGPNTILGKNTIYSLTDMEKLLGNLIEMSEKMFSKGFFSDKEGNSEIIRDVINMTKNLKFRKMTEEFVEKSFASTEERALTKQIADLFNENVDIEEFFSNYPLVFVCPPDERDKRITISQIHTHKIRGADIVLIAEDDEDLKNAALGVPANAENYWSKFIELPRTGDKNIFVFEAAVVLQLLALKMSVAKMKYLNRSEIQNHGVHPDVPKNVSKSITVD
ncbi:SIS domain-containing protein [bacterium]|nr:SIS domain-containing protein [bacterium]